MTDNQIKTPRNINLDFIRVISMLFVILIHTDRAFIGSLESSYLATMFYTLLFTCNSMFYMLSGRLNLQKTFQNKADYKKFYLDKMVSILLPYVFVTALISLNNMIVDGTWNGIILYIKITYNAFMESNASTHLWFMYPLMGMLLSTPFWAKMLQGVSDWELKILFAIALLWNVISIYLTLDVNIHFSYSGWLWSGCSIFYFLGYYCSRIVSDSNQIKFYVIGIGGVSLLF